MARGFGTTFGVGVTDGIVSTYAPSGIGGSPISISAWVWINATGGGGFGKVVDVQAGAWTLGMNNSGSVMRFPNSGSTFTGPAFNGWHHILATHVSGAKPIVYIDGVSVTTSSTAATLASGPFTIGQASGGTNRNWDGKLAEIAVWNNVILTASEAVALSKGVPARFIRPSQITAYFPLFGLQASEPEWGPSHFTQTITGTALQNHAPVSFWMQNSSVLDSSGSPIPPPPISDPYIIGTSMVKRGGTILNQGTTPLLWKGMVQDNLNIIPH